MLEDRLPAIIRIPVLVNEKFARKFSVSEPLKVTVPVLTLIVDDPFAFELFAATDAFPPTVNDLSLTLTVCCTEPGF